MNPKSPLFKGWQTPVNNQIPRKLLAYYLQKASNMAIEKGMGPALGLSPDEAGSQRKERGSDQESGRLSQAPPEQGAVESGANSVEAPSA
mgnify:CR=1 FL=1